MKRPASGSVLAGSLASSLALVVSLSAAPAAAQSKAPRDSDAAARGESERAGKEGERLLAQHDAAGAITELGKAYNLSHNPRFLLPLGLAYAEAERPLDALDALGRFLKDAPAVPDAKVTMFAGASYTFELEFKTGMTPGEFNTEITVTSTDASSPLTIPVRGLAGPPKAKVPYASILLPDVPAGAKGLPMNITLTNEGFSDLKVDSITASSADFEVPNAPSAMSPLVVPAKESRIFQLVFAPQMEGLRTGKLTIKSNEPAPMMGTSDIIIDLAGNGTKPKFKVSTNELNFSMVNIGTAVPPQTVNLTNEGDGDLTVKEVSIMPAAMGAGAESFAVSTPDPVPFVLRAGATVPVKVTFTPKSAGTLAATLKIVTDLATGGAAAIALPAPRLRGRAVRNE